MKHIYRMTTTESKQWYTGHEALRSVIRYYARARAEKDGCKSGTIVDDIGEAVTDFETVGAQATADAAIYDSRRQYSRQRPDGIPA